ncbi:MAG: PIN domain-containing protein [Ancrocorticia sp.]|uniref:PIN domain-containing protein n=1 Tax=Ancrocorticia sp. TaxID=2593684 RepID=UPI003F910268
MTLIADTGAIYACYDRADAHHVAVSRYLTGFSEKLWVPALVLAELDHLVATRLGKHARGIVLDDVLETMTVIPFDHNIAVRSASVAREYDEFPLGLTDATLVVHAQDYRTCDLLTVDQRHFRAVTPLSGEKSFRLFPFDA